MNNNVKKLIGDIANKCLANGFSFKLEAKKSVQAGEGIDCSGYFDEKDLVVASAKKDWRDVLVHESCHLDQFVENSKYWDDGECGIIILDKWLMKKANYNKKRLEKAIQNTILLELDCEKRTVKKMIRYGIKFNKTKYIQKHRGSRDTQRTHTSRYTKSIIHSASKKIGATCHGSRNLFVTRTSRAAHPPARLAASDTEKEHWPAQRSRPVFIIMTRPPQRFEPSSHGL